MADWIDELIALNLTGFGRTPDATAELARIANRGRAKLAQVNDPSKQREARLALEQLTRRIATSATRKPVGSASRTVRSAAGASGPGDAAPLIVDGAVIKTAMNGFCPKWPWC